MIGEASETTVRAPSSGSPDHVPSALRRAYDAALRASWSCRSPLLAPQARAAQDIILSARCERQAPTLRSHATGADGGARFLRRTSASRSSNTSLRSRADAFRFGPQGRIAASAEERGLTQRIRSSTDVFGQPIHAGASGAYGSSRILTAFFWFFLHLSARFRTKPSCYRCASTRSLVHCIESLVRMLRVVVEARR
jgi:hypothetical protein